MLHEDIHYSPTASHRRSLHDFSISSPRSCCTTTPTVQFSFHFLFPSPTRSLCQLSGLFLVLVFNIKYHIKPTQCFCNLVLMLEYTESQCISTLAMNLPRSTCIKLRHEYMSILIRTHPDCVCSWKMSALVPCHRREKGGDFSHLFTLTK